MMHRYLYLIEYNNLYKIGISTNPDRRMSQLTLGKKATLKWYNKYPNTYKFEQYLHKQLKTHAYSGEWFNLKDNELQWIIEESYDDFVLGNEVFL